MADDDRLTSFIDDPETIRCLSDDEVAELCNEAVEKIDFLFTPGTLQGGYPMEIGDQVVNWMIALEDADGKGLVVPNFPKSWLRFACRLSEEYIVRYFTRISSGILADIVANPESYRNVLRAFGEDAIWRKQLHNKLNREAYPDELPSNELPCLLSKDAVSAYRRDIEEQLEQGDLQPVSSENIIAQGIKLFRKRYECVDQHPVTDMLARFGSRLRFLANGFICDETGYIFTLGSTKEHDDPRLFRDPFEVKPVVTVLVSSPLTPPDATDWLPL